MITEQEEQEFKNINKEPCLKCGLNYCDCDFIGFEEMGKSLLEEWNEFKNSYEKGLFLACVEFAEHLKGMAHTIGELNGLTIKETLKGFSFIDSKELQEKQNKAREELKKRK